MGINFFNFNWGGRREVLGFIMINVQEKQEGL